MTAALLCILVILIAIIDARSRRIPEAICVGGILFALFWATVSPLDRFGLIGLGLPWPITVCLWASLVLLVQPGMVFDLTRNPSSSIGILFVSIRRRGVLSIAIPLIAMGSLAIMVASRFSPVRLVEMEEVAAGAAIGLISLGLPHLIGRAVLGGGAIGSGDCLMLAMVGALAGPLVVVVVAALTIGGLVLVSLVGYLVGRNALPLGPVIASATLMTLAFWSRFWPKIAVAFSDPVLIGAVWSIGVSCLTVMGGVWLAGHSRRRGESMRWVVLALCGLLAIGTGLATMQLRGGTDESVTKSPLKKVLTGGLEIASGGGALAVNDKQSGETQLMAGSHSVEAMLQSDCRGVNWIELGLVMTADEKVVAFRDWGEPARHWLGKQWTGKPLTKRLFISAAKNRGWTPVDIDALVHWLEQNEKRHVLLSGENVWATLRRGADLAGASAAVGKRMIAMVEDADSIAATRSAGFPYHVWVVRPDVAVSDYEILQHCRQHRPVAVAAHYGRLRDSSLPEKLRRLGIPSIATDVKTQVQKTASGADAVLTDLAGYPMP